MQILSRGKALNGMRPECCLSCGCARLHRHGDYPRGAVWALGEEEQTEWVPRYICVGCGKTTSVLPNGLLTYRLLSLAIVARHLFDERVRQWSELLKKYRKRWEAGYGRLKQAVGRLFGDDLAQESHEGWMKLIGIDEVNSELVDRLGWSLFGRYRIHVPQTLLAK